jgi:PAS domain S-box-containing protein
MPDPAGNPGSQSQLRLDAELKLREGIAPLTNGWGVSADALALLYRLAVAPDSAGDALKLLHELQAHQVELDLQHGQLQANEHEFAQELDRYKALFDFAPVGYLVVGRGGLVIEGNLAGARLLGVEPDEVGGRPVADFLAPGSRLALLGLLKKLRDGGAGASCEVQTANGEGGLRPIRIVADMAPGGEAVLMIVSESARTQGV